MQKNRAQHIKPFNEHDVKVSKVAEFHGSHGRKISDLNINGLVTNQHDVETFRFFHALGGSLDYTTIVNLYTTVH